LLKAFMEKKLLVVTQKVDKKDPVLGFFHGWLGAFSLVFPKLTVICLEQGETSLPAGVKVLSLGKETNTSLQRTKPGLARLKYVWRFARYIVQIRDEYDAVFVHMNPEYVILGGLIWRLLRKKVTLWYNHDKGGLKLYLAIILAQIVFHASPYSASSGFKKSRQMPVGVDTNIFYDKRERGEDDNNKLKLLYLGRLAPIKGIELMIEAVRRLIKAGTLVEFTMVGCATAKDYDYRDKLLSSLNDPVFKGRVKVLPAESSRERVAEFYNAHDVFINASPPGLFDKTVFEAMACGVIPLVGSVAFEGLLPPQCLFKQGDARDLAEHLIKISNLTFNERQVLSVSLRQSVLLGHSLNMLAERLGHIIKEL